MKSPFEHQYSYIPLDLMELASVTACTKRIATLTERIDLLILNAGIAWVGAPTAITPPSANSVGIDAVFAANLVGHATLTHQLLPLLRTSAHPRILATSSAAHFIGEPSRVRRLPYLPQNRSDSESGSIRTLALLFCLTLSSPPSFLSNYEDSKLALHLFGLALTERERDLQYITVNPGGVHTEIVSSSIAKLCPRLPKCMHCSPHDVHPRTSAQIFLFAVDLDASGRALAHVAGSYYCAGCPQAAPCCECFQKCSWYPREARDSPHARNAEAAADLWRWTIEEGAPGPPPPSQAMHRD